jgi:hypothetical protein
LSNDKRDGKKVVKIDGFRFKIILPRFLKNLLRAPSCDRPSKTCLFLLNTTNVLKLNATLMSDCGGEKLLGWKCYSSAQ